MARPAAIWQTVEILQQPATRNQRIHEVITRSKPHSRQVKTQCSGSSGSEPPLQRPIGFCLQMQPAIGPIGFLSASCSISLKSSLCFSESQRGTSQRLHRETGRDAMHCWGVLSLTQFTINIIAIEVSVVKCLKKTDLKTDLRSW